MTEANNDLETRMAAVQRKMAAVTGGPAPTLPAAKPISQEDYKELFERLDQMCLSPTGATKAALMTIHKYVKEWQLANPGVKPSDYGSHTEKSKTRNWGFPEKFVRLYEVVMGYEAIPPPIYSIPAASSDAREIFKSSIRASSVDGK